MKVILREDVEGKGAAGEIIEVKSGFARNYLIPQGYAYLANDKNLKVFEHDKVMKAKEREKTRADAETRKIELEKISLTAAVKVGDDGRLFGSVTTHTLSELLTEQGYDFNHRKIILEEPIKELGVFEVGVDIGSGVEARIKVWIVKE